MNENKRLYVIVGILIVLIVITGISTIVDRRQNAKIYEKFETAFNAEKEQIIFLERPTCSYCQLTIPIMESLSGKYNFTYNDINTDKISSSNLSKILDKLGVSKDDFGTPYIAIVKNGKVVATQPGYAEESAMFEFFQNNGIIDEKEEYKEILNYVDYNEYKSLISSSNAQLIVMVQTGCSACISAKPILEQIVEENNITINALNITNLSDDDKESLSSSLDYLNENDWGTPLLLVVKDNKVIDASNGYLDKKTYETFLNKNGFIK